LRAIGLYSVLEKEGGNYTKNALLYQDILRYLLGEKMDRANSGTGGPFTHRNVAKWLLRNNLEFSNLYKDSDSHTRGNIKIEHTQQRVKDRLGDLVSLDLLDVSIIKQTKGTGTTFLYNGTYYGYLIAWVMESFDPAKRQNANNEIYKIFEGILKRTNYSSAAYKLLLHKKFKEVGAFGTFVVDMMRERLSTATNMTHLLSSLTMLVNPKKEDGDLFLRLSNEAMNELGPDQKKHFLHHQKLEIEDKMLSQAKNPALYERMQDGVKDKPDLVAVEGICEKCQYTFALAITTLEYVQKTQTSPSGPLILPKCPKCKGLDSVLIPVV
jgi:hypothetical protein